MTRIVCHHCLNPSDYTDCTCGYGKSAQAVMIPAHGVQTILSAAALLEQSPNIIDRREGAALRRLANSPEARAGDCDHLHTIGGPDGAICCADCDAMLTTKATP